VGGFVREGDVDRREQGRIAVGELEKLALYALDRPITPEDVRALVSEAVPGSIWAFVDAVGMRQGAKATALLERLLPDTPEPVLLAVLHRRIRELAEVQDRLAGGEAPGSLVRSMRLVPFRAEMLARQANQWSADALDAALDGLVDLDATVKGVPGMPAGDEQHRLAFTLWVRDAVAPGG
jgi:DNA polymerase III delta subunit